MSQILAAVNTVSETEHILRYSAELSRGLGDDLIVVNAFEQPYAELNEDWAEELHEYRESSIRDSIDLAGVTELVDEVEVLPDSPHKALADRVNRDGVRAIVVGQHGSPGTGGLEGTGTALYLAHHSRQPVLAIDAQDSVGPGPIIVGVDGSTANRRALDFAEQLAISMDRDVLAVFCPSPLSDSFPHGTHHTTQPDAVELSDTGTTAENGRGWEYPHENQIHKEIEAVLRATTQLVVEPGHPIDVLQEVARRRDASMLVVGTRGHGSLGGIVVGSVPKALLNTTADRPVLIVPH